MRHIKLFIGIGTLALGVAGAFATMATNSRYAMGKVWTSLKVACITIYTPCLLDRSGVTCFTVLGQIPRNTIFTLASICGGNVFRRIYN
ncbi:hypothetical protein UNH65_09605 [Chitinophaga sp. 180180018-2]|nr:hypothetical protein [Chitinophaga sp. 212800010-3]